MKHKKKCIEQLIFEELNLKKRNVTRFASIYFNKNMYDIYCKLEIKYNKAKSYELVILKNKIRMLDIEEDVTRLIENHYKLKLTKDED